MTFVTVYRAHNAIEAAMVRDFLNDNDIQCMTRSQLPEAVYGSAVEPIEVRVDAAKQARALELIEAYFSSEVELVDEDPHAP